MSVFVKNKKRCRLATVIQVASGVGFWVSIWMLEFSDPGRATYVACASTYVLLVGFVTQYECTE